MINIEKVTEEDLDNLIRWKILLHNTINHIYQAEKDKYPKTLDEMFRRKGMKYYLSETSNLIGKLKRMKNNGNFNDKFILQQVNMYNKNQEYEIK